jgi:mannose-6-phosphate isomerase
VLRIAEVHPGDVGIVAPLILNVFSLAPGEAIYQPAGVLHAYLHGVGAELMANSDNVLRGGMTVKHIDVAELMKVGVFTPDRPEPVAPESSSAVSGSGVRAEVFPTPFEEFALHRLELDRGEATISGGLPQIIFCHEGSGEALAGPAKSLLQPGESAFVEAATDDITLTGSGVFFIARIP